MNTYLVVYQHGSEKISKILRSDSERLISQFFEKRKPELDILAIVSGVQHDTEISTIYQSDLQPRNEDFEPKAFVVVGGRHLMPRTKGDKS